MTELARSASGLAGLQNADGGWPYKPGGSSWTEPTCFALLALCADQQGQQCAAAERGLQWLLSRQKPDGGWSPADAVPQSTWVTALAVLAVQSRASKAAVDGGVQWLLASTGRESNWRERLRALLMGQRPPSNVEGWPWFPGAAAWLEPTALTVICLRKLRGSGLRASAGERVRMGTEFILSRQCRDGGWNHGSTRALGYDSDSYPESTGWALMALRGVKGEKLSSGLRSAGHHLSQSPIGEARSLLELGLAAQGQKLSDSAAGPPPSERCRPLSLWLIAAAAREGRHVL